MAELTLYDRNPRKGDIDAIARSLARFGQRKPIVVTADGTIIAGNHTFQAAEELGWTTIAVVAVEDDEQTAAAFALADNRTSDLGRYDPQALADLISEVNNYDTELAADAGYNATAIAQALRTADVRREGHTAVDSLPELTNQAPKSAIGSIWQVGPHIVACGDSTSAPFVAEVLSHAGGQISAIITDPPYGVDYVSTTTHNINPVAVKVNIANDDLTGDALIDFVAAALRLGADAMDPGAPFYVFSPRFGPFAAAAINAGLDPRHELIWVKDAPVFGRAEYAYQHEKILAGGKPPPAADHEVITYGWLGGAAHRWYGGTTETSVFFVPKPSRNELHPTQKPVDILTAFAANSTRLGEWIYDPFAGSGSTMIAASVLDRRSVSIEIDPGYADTIIDRWLAWEGVTADAPGALERLA